MKKTGKRVAMAAIFVSAFLGLTACGNKEEAQPAAVESVNMSQTEASEAAAQPEAAEASETAKQEVTPDAMQSALVYLQSEDGKEQVSGSGFITEITEELIYICTNQHVIKGNEAWTVTFADGTQASARKAGTSQVFDVGVVTVYTSDVEAAAKEKLNPVTVDLDAWLAARDEENSQPAIRVYRMGEAGLTGECLEGKVDSVLADFTYGNGLNHTKMDISLEKGDSGSAVFDENGNLFAMAMGNSYAEEGKPVRWGVPLASLLTSYQEITGREWVPLF